MALQTINISDSFGTDAAFRTLGSSINSALSTLGFVQTADTGQVNWTTVVRAAVNTVAGYEIWRFADALQSSAPIFFKLEYGSASTTSAPAFWLTVGTASDGAGTITSAVGTGVSTTTRQALHQTTTATTGTVQNIYLWAETSGGGGLGVMFWPSVNEASYAGSFFGIDRFRSLDGTANGDGYNAWMSLAYSSGITGFLKSQPVFISSTITQPGQLSTGMVPSPGAGTGTNIIGSTLYPLPVFTGYPTPRLYGPSQMLVAYGRTDLATGGNTFTMTHYGVSHTWVCAGQAGAATGWGSWGMSSSTGWSFAMRGD